MQTHTLNPVVVDPSGSGALEVLESTLQTRVRLAKTIKALKRHMAEIPPRLLVGDVDLAGLIDVVEKSRADRPEMHVLLLTSGPADARISALLVETDGAVDVVRKPFSAAELLVRLRSLTALPARLATPSLGPFMKALHDPKTGRIDAKRIGEAFGISPSRLSSALGRTPQAVSKTPAAVSAQGALAHYYRSYELLLRLLGSPESVRVWLNSPQQDLGGERPIVLFEGGEAETVRNFLEMMYAGGPT